GPRAAQGEGLHLVDGVVAQGLAVADGHDAAREGRVDAAAEELVEPAAFRQGDHAGVSAGEDLDQLRAVGDQRELVDPGQGAEEGDAEVPAVLGDAERPAGGQVGQGVEGALEVGGGDVERQGGGDGGHGRDAAGGGAEAGGGGEGEAGGRRD